MEGDYYYTAIELAPLFWEDQPLVVSFLAFSSVPAYSLLSQHTGLLQYLERSCLGGIIGAGHWAFTDCVPELGLLSQREKKGQGRP